MFKKDYLKKALEDVEKEIADIESGDGLKDLGKEYQAACNRRERLLQMWNQRTTVIIGLFTAAVTVGGSFVTMYVGKVLDAKNTKDIVAMTMVFEKDDIITYSAGKEALRKAIKL